MNFAEQQADPRRRLIGLGSVLLFHVLLVYALVTGLAKKVVDVVRAPVETKIIEEIKKPPPPPEVVVPPPPKLEAPPPPFIPPPEIQVAVPPPPAPTITAVTPTPPPAPVAIAPAPPPVVATPAPPAPAPTGPVSVGVACTKTVKPDLPGIPATLGITGASITYKATTKDGKIVNIEFTKVQLKGGRDARIERAFVANVEQAVRQYICPGDHVFTQEIVFKVTE